MGTVLVGDTLTRMAMATLTHTALGSPAAVPASVVRAALHMPRRHLAQAYAQVHGGVRMLRPIKYASAGATA